MDNQICILIQARMGSTRMPNKIMLPFYNNQSILDLQIRRLRQLNCFIIVATSTASRDQVLEDYCIQHRLACFRGSESDVLLRFIQAAKYYHFKQIIRICSDNPFMDLEQLHHLVDTAYESKADYLSFHVNGQPSIKTHFGFWAEYVTLKALEKVDELTKEPLYHEHVTNYIYSHEQEFNIQWIDVPDSVAKRQDIRLTIDTEQDFDNSSQLYALVMERYDKISMNNVIAVLDEHPEMKCIMKSEIAKNSK